MPDPKFKIQARLLGGKILDWNDYEMPSGLRGRTWDSEAQALSEMERLAPLSGWPMADLRVVPADADHPNTPKPNPAAWRQNLYRRRNEGIAPGGRRIPCENCARRHTGAHGLLCWECARKTPEGRATVAQLVWEHRQRRKQKAKLKGDNP